MHAIFFSFVLKKKKKMSKDMLTSGYDEMRILDMLPRGSIDLEFWMCFLEVHGFEVRTCFSKVRGLKFGCAS